MRLARASSSSTTRRGSGCSSGRSRRSGASLPDGHRLAVYKNNSDGKGNSYGTHENYLVDRAVPFADIVRDLTPFFVTRQIFCGAGKLGGEASWDDTGGSATS